jgi:hypothetical protein
VSEFHCEGFDAQFHMFHVGLPLVAVFGLVLLANLPGGLSAEATQSGNDTKNSDFNAPQIKAA